MINRLTSTSLAATDSTKEYWKTVAMDQSQSIAKCWKNLLRVTSTNRGFRTIQHSLATYEQTKQGLFYFYPKRKVKEDGMHTKPLHL